MQASLLRASRDVHESPRPASTTSTVQASEHQQPQLTSAAPDAASTTIALRRLIHDQKQAAHRQIKTKPSGLRVEPRDTLVEG